jgi:uncharacterized protein (TIGR00251 family)
MEKIPACQLSVRIQPGARRSEVTRLVDGIWHIRVAAPPVEGRANLALVAFLAEKLDMPKSSLAIVRGLSSRNKKVEVTGLNETQVASRLKPT